MCQTSNGRNRKWYSGHRYSIRTFIKRNSLGIKLNKKYSDISKKRAGKELNKHSFVMCGDSSEIEKKYFKKIKEVLGTKEKEYFDYIITSPPYWDMLKKSRGNIKSAQKNILKMEEI